MTRKSEHLHKEAGLRVAQTKWLRLGVFVLSLAGLLLTVSLLVLSVTSGIAWSPDIDPRGTAAAVSAPGWPVG